MEYLQSVRQTQFSKMILFEIEEHLKMECFHDVKKCFTFLKCYFPRLLESVLTQLTFFCIPNKSVYSLNIVSSKSFLHLGFICTSGTRIAISVSWLSNQIVNK